LAITC
jgi:hypothetical protein